MPNSGFEREIMTVAEVADYLQLADKTIVRMAQSGRIPATKVASQWRFMRSVVRDWLAAQMQMEPTKPADQAGPRGLLSPADVIRPELITMAIEPGPKEHVLRQLAAPVIDTGFAADGPRLLRSLAERERMMTTAIGHGIALPHPRRPLRGMFAEPALAVGICREGTPFEAIDDQLVHVLVLICATREEIHLQLMATVSWLGRQEGFLETVSAAATPQEVMAIVADQQQRFGPTDPTVPN